MTADWADRGNRGGLGSVAEIFIHAHPTGFACLAVHDHGKWVGGGSPVEKRRRRFEIYLVNQTGKVAAADGLDLLLGGDAPIGESAVVLLVVGQVENGLCVGDSRHGASSAGWHADELVEIADGPSQAG